MQATRDIADGKDETGIARLLENNQFSRHLLKNSNTLVSHMVALSFLQKDTRIISELMAAQPELALKFKKSISQLLSPISGAEYSLVKSFAYERQLKLSITQNIENEMVNSESTFTNYFNRILAKLFYLPNAGNNLFYDFEELNIAMAKVSAFELDETRKSNAIAEKELLGFGIDFMYLRNPIMKILVSVAQPSYGDYIERQHDLDGYLTLVRLQQKLLGDQMSGDQLLTVLPTFLNPYTHQPMRVDAQNGVIIFEGRQASNTNFERSRLSQIAMPR